MRAIRSIVMTWPVRAEALIVIGGAFGYFLLATAFSLLGLVKGAAITDHHLRFLLIHESVALLVLGGFLHLRGWTWQRIGLRPRFRDTLIGAGLAVAVYAAFMALWFIAMKLNLPPTGLNGRGGLVAGPLTMASVIGVSVLNPFFEEIFVCGYVITLAREHDCLSKGVNASIAIRLGYHLYQGGAGVVAIVPFGLICALWYARTGRLWPVVVAHGISDFIGLVGYVP